MPSLDRELTGTVQVINPVADPTSRSFYVKVLLPNPGLRLLPGNAGRPCAFRCRPASRPAPVVAVAPQLVVQEADGASAVYVVDAGGTTAHRRRVVLGPVQGQQVVITQGLKADERVVVAGQQGPARRAGRAHFVVPSRPPKAPHPLAASALCAESPKRRGGTSPLVFKINC